MLTRAIMILDAAVRRRNSGASLHNWRVKAPLKRLLRENKGKYPALRGAIMESQHETDIDFEGVLSQLSEVWAAASGRALDPQHIRSLINRYYPVAARIPKDQGMNTVLKVAREHLAQVAIHQ